MELNTKQRSDLKCLSLGAEAYSFGKTLAHEAGLSVSAYIRQLIKKQYQKYQRKLVLSTEQE